jgi:hypothetical protein
VTLPGLTISTAIATTAASYITTSTPGVVTTTMSGIRMRPGATRTLTGISTSKPSGTAADRADQSRDDIR